jgi:hypothetical protein
MKTMRIFFVVGLFFFLFSSSAHASPNWPAQDGELIVRFKKEQTPIMLKQQVDERIVAGKPFSKKIKVWFEDVRNVITRVDSPEEHLDAIEKIDRQIGVAAREIILTDENIDDIFIISYTNNISPIAASALYNSLSEVEFAEPNYLYDEFGI